MMPENHPKLLGVMKLLADTYLDMENLGLAEDLYGKILMERKRTEEHNSRTLLWSQVNLIHCITRRGRYKEAEAMHGPVHSSILASFHPTDDLVALSLGALSVILYNQGRFEEAEVPQRYQLQIRLANYGPEDPKTISAMARLGDCLAEMGDFSGGGQLLQASVQLSSHVPGGFDASSASAMSGLIWLLRIQKRYEESITLGEMVVQWANTTLGEEHPRTMQCCTEFGTSLRERGMLEASENILTKTIKKQTLVLVKNNPIALWTMHELGRTLLRNKRYEEATIWLEKSYRGRLKVYNSVDTKGKSATARSCDLLGACYRYQGQREKAFTLYQQFMFEVQSTQGNIRLEPEMQDYIDDFLYLCEAYEMDGDEEDDEEMELLECDLCLLE
jgi:tetratricopeptide (TPR) repeat protein